MPRSDWLRTATGVGLVCALSIIAGMLWLGLALDDQSYRQIERYCSDNPSQCDASEPSSIVGSVPPTESQEIANQPKWWERSDLDAQRQMARWTAIIGILTGGGIVILGWTLWETRQVTIETRRIGEKQVQAYLICNAGTLRLRKVDYDGVIRHAPNFNLPIVNKGQSPGRNIDIECTIRLFKVSGPGRAYSVHSEDEKTFCADVAPGSEEIAIVETIAIRAGDHVDAGEKVWMTIEGMMFWTNEFGSRQEQAINLVSPPFNWPNDIDPPKRDPIPLKGVGRREMLRGRQHGGNGN